MSSQKRTGRVRFKSEFPTIKVTKDVDLIIKIKNIHGDGFAGAKGDGSALPLNFKDFRYFQVGLRDLLLMMHPPQDRRCSYTGKEYERKYFFS